ncbi:MAG: M15 family metallopeptidase [Defluviitaleaceae bacterium]|nr:M15 family metallopeptidase [Defluviitaleaceae bacterium]
MYKRICLIFLSALFFGNVIYARIVNQDEAYYLRLINQNNPLPDNYEPENMINIALYVRSTRSEIWMEERAGRSFIEMVNSMVLDGVEDMAAVSGFRDFSHQTTLFNRQVARHSYLSSEEAFRRAAMVVAPPGASEHQSGLAIDVSSSQVSFALSQRFENTDAFTWLLENAHKYGFIIRYPRDKTYITGIVYEPWHLRYVGVFHAERMVELGLVLEEYWETLEISSTLAITTTIESENRAEEENRDGLAERIRRFLSRF